MKAPANRNKKSSSTLLLSAAGWLIAIATFIYAVFWFFS